MKKQIVLLAALLGGTLAGNAQKKGFDYKFYGQVRTDLFYNSRSNSEPVEFGNGGRTVLYVSAG